MIKPEWRKVTRYGIHISTNRLSLHVGITDMFDDINMIMKSNATNQQGQGVFNILYALFTDFHFTIMFCKTWNYMKITE